MHHHVEMHEFNKQRTITHVQRPHHHHPTNALPSTAALGNLLMTTMMIVHTQTYNRTHIVHTRTHIHV